MPPKKNSAISVRLSDDRHEELRVLANATRIKPATLVHIAIDGLLDYARAHQGRLMLPLDFTSAWGELTKLEALLDTHLQEHPLPRAAEDATGYPASADPDPDELSAKGLADVKSAMKRAAGKRRKGSNSTKTS